MSGYRFRSGSPIDMKALDRAISYAHGAAHQMTVARTFDGRSDVRRDLALEEAQAALGQAMAELHRATHPEPPKIAPPAMPTFFAVACDIAHHQKEVA